MVAGRFGRELGRKIRSPEAARLDAERSARADRWAAAHPVPALLLGAAVFALVGWAVAGRLEITTTTGVIVCQVICVPVGLIATWVQIVRARRRGSRDRHEP
ncbi:hypothetical protein [Saccharothrix xinjiangensis]|uniref:SdpI/YhfL family protein n=1 Tax=Saccharothrix xinjiangensis TaxID=204798 RepID=A0ABV9Y300_9PSEU